VLLGVNPRAVASLLGKCQLRCMPIVAREEIGSRCVGVMENLFAIDAFLEHVSYSGVQRKLTTANALITESAMGGPLKGEPRFGRSALPPSQ
jgi:hypothetical protein